MKWFLILGCVLLVVLVVLVVAAAWASRSRPTQAPSSTPTQQTQNPYRRFFDYRKK